MYMGKKVVAAANSTPNLLCIHGNICLDSRHIQAYVCRGFSVWLAKSRVCSCTERAKHTSVHHLGPEPAAMMLLPSFLRFIPLSPLRQFENCCYLCCIVFGVARSLISCSGMVVWRGCVVLKLQNLEQALQKA